MQLIKKLFPETVSKLLKLLAIPLFMLLITRMIFYFSNIHSFDEMGGKYWLLGIWFDVITIALLFLPFYTLFLLPFSFRHNRLYLLLLKSIFHIINTAIIAVNLIDVEYFKFTSKRSTADLFSMVSTGNDVNQLLGSFLADFWLLIVILIVLIATSEVLYRRVMKDGIHFSTNTLLSSTIYFIVLIPTLFFIGRGGFGLKPIGVIEAANYTEGKFTAFVLPTPFTMIKTIDQHGIQYANYFSEEKAETYFNPLKKSQPQLIFDERKNVVFLILESFGTEFIGFYSKEESYAPFLDSILSKSIAFDYAFSNGKKSIEAVPAIFASLPTLMDSPYISSPYGNNKIEALPTILKRYGYTSAFYHGATNGSMSFDGFATLSGFDHYVGRSEYNNEDHSDHKWGILDEYFNPWTAKQISNLPQPFLASLFTLSSHHPYYIPDHMKSKVKNGPQPICASISYADFALRSFFETAKTQPWYDNTLFVILADHTPATTTKFYSQRSQMYRIPMAIYDPSGKLAPERNKQVMQQMDLMPTILDLLNIDTEFYSFGNSVFSKEPREAITYIQGSYNYFRGNEMFIFSNDHIQSIEVFDSIKAPEPKELRAYENRIKAIIQMYNADLINNKTHVSEK